MARLRPINKIVQVYNVIPMKAGANKIVEWSLQARRAIVLGRRLAGGAIFGPKDPNVREHSIIDPYAADLVERREEIKPAAANVVEHLDMAHNKDQIVLSDFVAIIDIDAEGYNKGYETIKLPFIPKELNYGAESNYATIKPIGRNTPKYHFTGSEDILEFEIDWHSLDSDRRDVITKCRRIESLSKADGYDGDPHRVMLKWGAADILFEDHIFIVLSAKYRLTQFSKGYLDKKGNIVNNYMLPVQAYQTVRLGRVSSYNLTKNAIEHVGATPTTSNTEKRSNLNKGV